MGYLPAFAKKYFWDIDTEQFDPQKNPEHVIGRILEYGDMEAVHWMFQVFDRELIKKTFLRKKSFSRVTANFWRLFFDLNKEDVLCLKRLSPQNQKSHWPY